MFDVLVYPESREVLQGGLPKPALQSSRQPVWWSLWGSLGDCEHNPAEPPGALKQMTPGYWQMKARFSAPRFICKMQVDRLLVPCRFIQSFPACYSHP
jgi:hypothetical protein